MPILIRAIYENHGSQLHRGGRATEAKAFL
jgi:hypothetical protein